MLSSRSYQTRMKNILTHPKLLFIWPWWWTSTLYVLDSSVKQPARAPFLCPVEWHYSLLVSLYWTLHPHWMICTLVCSQKKDWQNKTLAWVLQGCVMPAPEVGGNTRVHIWHDWSEFAKWKGHFKGIFLGPFQCDKGSVSVKLPVLMLLKTENITYNMVSTYLSSLVVVLWF